MTPPLTIDQVKALWAVAMSYDNRKLPGDANLSAWSEASSRGRWTFPAAVNAIHEHYSQTTDFLMPGHITQLIRSDMRQPPPLREALDGRDPTGQARVAAITSGAFPAMPGDDPARPAVQTSALDRTCPHCGAKPGQACTRRTLTGRVRARQAHPSRKASSS